MVERIQEGMTAPIPETKIRVLETTLAELGVDTSFDNLNLGEDKFTLGVKRVGEDTVFVGRLDHPFAGGHFAQYLNSIAPFGDQNIRGIIDDLELPKLAERDYQRGKDRTTSDSIRLHERHLGDPKVKGSYEQFAKDHVDSWLNALKFSRGLQVFDRLQRIRFIDGWDSMGEELIYRYFISFNRQIFVDLEAHKIISNESNRHDGVGKGKVKFTGNGKNVLITDKNGTEVEITPTGRNDQRFTWKVLRYQFPQDYEEFSLYPAFAWRKDENGGRIFLIQEEAMPLLRELGVKEGEQGDVKLGEIGVGYFSRDIIGKWPAKMPLKPLDGVDREGDYFEQPMRGAQMPAWVAVEAHKDELLRSETSPLAIIEGNLDLAA